MNSVTYGYYHPFYIIGFFSRENIENKVSFNVCCGGKDGNLEKADDNAETGGEDKTGK